jgi:hypothetical protein
MRHGIGFIELWVVLVFLIGWGILEWLASRVPHGERGDGSREDGSRKDGSREDGSKGDSGHSERQ